MLYLVDNYWVIRFFVFLVLWLYIFGPLVFIYLVVWFRSLQKQTKDCVNLLILISQSLFEHYHLIQMLWVLFDGVRKKQFLWWHFNSFGPRWFTSQKTSSVTWVFWYVCYSLFIEYYDSVKERCLIPIHQYWVRSECH